MTDVTVAPRIENPLSDTETIASSGWINVRPSKPYVSGGQWVQDVWPPNTINLDGTVKTLKLDPLADVPYEMFFHIPQGKGRPPKEWNEFRIVVGAGPVAWETLLQTDGPGGDPVLTNVVDARLDALEASLGTVSGGASNVASITDMSPLARLFNKDTTQGAMQARLNVPAVGAAPTAHTHVATTDLTATGTKNTTTFLRGDNTWAAPPAGGAVNYTDLVGTPSTFTPSAHTHVVTDIVGESTTVGSFLASTTQLGARTAIGAADGTTTAFIRIPWRQVGGSYPTPLPDGFYGFTFEGQLDPRTQAGITVNPNTDRWDQLP